MRHGLSFLALSDDFHSVPGWQMAVTAVIHLQVITWLSHDLLRRIHPITRWQQDGDYDIKHCHLLYFWWPL